MYVRKGGGAFRATTIDRKAGQFDLALGPDGRPRLVFIDRNGRLALYNGSRVLRSRAPMASVGLAVDVAGRMHVVAAPTAQACHTTSI